MQNNPVFWYRITQPRRHTRESATSFKTGHTTTTPRQPSPAPHAHPAATPSLLWTLQPLPPPRCPRLRPGLPLRARGGAGPGRPQQPLGVTRPPPGCRPGPGRTTAVRSCTLLGSGSAMLGSGRLGGRSAPQRHRFRDAPRRFRRGRVSREEETPGCSGKCSPEGRVVIALPCPPVGGAGRIVVS